MVALSIPMQILENTTIARAQSFKVIGGMEIVMEFHLTNGSIVYFRCTSGFVAYTTAYTGSLTYGIITAGHCANPDGIADLIDYDYPITVYYVYTDNQGNQQISVIGEFWTWYKEPDVGFIMLYNNVESYPSVRWGNGDEKPVAGIKDPQPGMDVVTLGAVTGSVPSTVLGYSDTHGCWLSVFSSTVTEGGDSGAPVVKYDSSMGVVYAVGIHIGVTGHTTPSGEFVPEALCFVDARTAENTLAANIDTW